MDGKVCSGALEFSSYESQLCCYGLCIAILTIGDFEKSLSQPFNVGIGKN